MVSHDRYPGRCLAAALVLLLAMACPPAAAQILNPRLRVTIPVLGAIRGGTCPNSNAGAAYRFMGIPFAQAPVGPLRFAPPVPYNTPFSGEWDARNPGPYCIQDPQRGLGVNLATSFSEDCLHVNVWTPQNITGGKPVRVLINGGGMVSGSGAWPAFDGCANVRDADIVTVTFNYRVGVLGFLGLPGLAAANSSTGNWGLMDVHLALQWVQTNIAAFGGDPNRVTVHGQSGGAALTLATLVSPAARNSTGGSRWFSGMILASPSTYVYSSLSDVYAQGREFAALSNCSATDFACLRALSTNAIVAAQRRMLISEFGPTVDGVLVPDTPSHMLSLGQTLVVPTLVITSLDESNYVVAQVSGPRGILNETQARNIIISQINPPLRYRERVFSTYNAAAFGGSWFTATSMALAEWRYHCGAHRILNQMANQGAPVYAGIFNLPPTNGCPWQVVGVPAAATTTLGPLLGAMHGADITYTYQLPLNSTTTSAWNCGFTPQEVQMAAFMGGSLAAFVENRRPVPRNSRTATSTALQNATWPLWTGFDPNQVQWIHIDAPAVVNWPSEAVQRCGLWNDVRDWMDDNGKYGAVPTVQDYITSRPDLTLIAAALRATGEWAALAGGSATYFLPTDGAITNLMAALNITDAADLLALPTLRNILRYHVYPTAINVARDEPPRRRITMLSGRPAYLMRTNGEVRILDTELNAALVLANGTSVPAGRSLINVVDRVLLPNC